jgi:hypothetical protein
MTSQSRRCKMRSGVCAGEFIKWHRRYWDTGNNLFE